MRDQRIAAQPPAPPPARSVSGLGVCDVWRLELSAAQWPWLLDEIEEMRRPLENALERARTEYDTSPDGEAAADLDARNYELKLLAMMRAELPAIPYREAIVFTGPVPLVRELVAGTVRNVVGTLAEAVDAQRMSSPGGRERVAEVAGAAYAWAQTYLECEELERFSFDLEADPAPRR
jgi:hypothetical protein